MAKHDLIFDPPLMNAAGTLGFYPDLHRGMDWGQLGAFVTNPISQAARTPARGTRFISYPGGFLLHTGYPNPGLSQTLRRYARHWSHSPRPVIVHILAAGPADLARMVQQLENVEGVVSLELGVDRDVSREGVIALTQAAVGELPVIVRLPMERALELASGTIQAGAMAISLAPPRGILPTPEQELLQGRLYGPAILPLALRIVQELVRLRIPTIAAGGVFSQEQVRILLTAGAMAVQLDAVLWRGGGNRIF